jgi:hypothetical protein
MSETACRHVPTILEPPRVYKLLWNPATFTPKPKSTLAYLLQTENCQNMDIYKVIEGWLKDVLSRWLWISRNLLDYNYIEMGGLKDDP